MKVDKLNKYWFKRIKDVIMLFMVFFKRLSLVIYWILFFWNLYFVVIIFIWNCDILIEVSWWD